MSEKSEIQDKIEEYLDSKGIKYIHIENNYRQQKYRNSKYKKYKGCPDHIIPMGKSITLYLEYKLHYNKLSAEQMDWVDYLEDREHFIYKVNSFEEGKKIIDFFMRETL